MRHSDPACTKAVPKIAKDANFHDIPQDADPDSSSISSLDNGWKTFMDLRESTLVQEEDREQCSNLFATQIRPHGTEHVTIRQGKARARLRVRRARAAAGRTAGAAQMTGRRRCGAREFGPAPGAARPASPAAAPHAVADCPAPAHGRGLSCCAAHKTKFKILYFKIYTVVVNVNPTIKNGPVQHAHAAHFFCGCTLASPHTADLSLGKQEMPGTFSFVSI